MRKIISTHDIPMGSFRGLYRLVITGQFYLFLTIVRYDWDNP